VLLDDPAAVPVAIAEYLAEHLEIEDASALEAYGEREYPGSTTCASCGGC
jgi:hypothetical protein